MKMKSRNYLTANCKQRAKNL